MNRPTQNFLFDAVDAAQEYQNDMDAATDMTFTDSRCIDIEKNLGTAAAQWADQNAAGWVLDRLADPVDALAFGLKVLPVAISARLAPKGRPSCPGCSNTGVATDTNPCVYSCNSCGGLFTVRVIGWQECLAFVDLNAAMQPNGQRQALQYFDFTYAGPSCGGGQPQRVHGWFDRTTRKVVQFG